MVEWIVSSCALILIVTALRFLLKGKLSLRLQYALWGLVLLRLLVPVQFGSSSLSIGNLTEAVADTPVAETLEIVGSLDIPKQSFQSAYNQVVQSYEEQGIDVASLEGSALEALDNEAYSLMQGPELGELLKTAALVVWAAGMAGMLLSTLLSNVYFLRRLKRSRQKIEQEGSQLPVYLSELIETPCLFGLFRPAIYVTPEVMANETAMRHVSAHETTHYRHGDHVWSLLRCICLALHWYNPLVWLAASLSRRDGELACDEGTLKQIGEEERAGYGRTLIGLTCTKRGALLTTATTMTGSKRSIKERIALIARGPKTLAIALIISIAVSLVAVGCTFTGARSEELSFPDDFEPAGELVIGGEEQPDDAPAQTSVTPSGVDVDGASRPGLSFQPSEIYVRGEDAAGVSVRITVKLLENPDTPSGYEIASVEEPVIVRYPDQPDVNVRDYSIAIEGTVYDSAKQTATVSLEFPTKKDSADRTVGNVTIRLREKAEDTVFLTDEELSRVNEAFTRFLELEEGLLTINPLCCFLTSYYDDVKELDFDSFLAYLPSDEYAAEEEFEALKALDGFLFSSVATLKDMPVPVHKFPTQTVDEVLRKYAGISLLELNDAGKDGDGMYYLEEYDAYYNFTSDAGAGILACVRGELRGDTVILYSQGAVLTLRKSGEDYLIQSYQPIQSSPYSILQIS